MKMKVSADHQRVINMLKESISLMCKSSLCFDIELSVEGLLGVTLDKKDIFLVSINELIQKNVPAVQRSENSGYSMIKGEEGRERETHSPPPRKKRHRRRHSSQNSTGSDIQFEDDRATTADKRDSEVLDIPGIKTEESESQQQQQQEIVIKQEVDQDAFIDSDSFSGVADLEGEMPYPMTITRASGGVDLGDDMSMATTSQNLQIPLMEPSPSTSTYKHYPPKTRFDRGAHPIRRKNGPATSDVQVFRRRNHPRDRPDKRYKCSYCSRSFSKSHSQMAHQRTHTGQGPTCESCGKCFPAVSSLKEHMWKHANVTFPCDLCKNVYRSPKAWRAHKRKEHGMRTFGDEEQAALAAIASKSGHDLT